MDSTTIHIKNRHELCIRTDEMIRRNELTLRIGRNRGNFQLILKNQKRIQDEIDGNRIKPNEKKVEAILNSKPLEITKDLKYFPGALQNMENSNRNVRSKQTD